MTFEPTSSASSFTSSSRTNSCEYDGCSSPELDVVSFTPGPQSSSSSADDLNNQKRYFCQRCLNHGLEFPRKGHKPFCRFAMCHCEDCMMVEYRRRLNNQLSQRRLDPEQAAAAAAAVATAVNGGKRIGAGKKVRDPKCARCSAHGEKQALRGHKKALCPYLKCGCHLCNLVENRRSLMAKQIKLRRDQQKARRAQPLSSQNQDTSQSKNVDEYHDETQDIVKTEIKEKEFSQLKTFAIPNECSRNEAVGVTDGNSNRGTAIKSNKNGCSAFARPFGIGALGNRKRSYGSAIDVEKSRILSSNNNNSYSSNSSSVLNVNNSSNVSSPIVATSISPILLPPSLLYQQLCLQSQQRKQQMVDNNSTIMQSTANGLNFLAQLNAAILDPGASSNLPTAVPTTSTSDLHIFNQFPFSQPPNANSLFPVGANLQTHTNLPNTQALVNSMLLVNNFTSTQPSSGVANLNANFACPPGKLELSSGQTPSLTTNQTFSSLLSTTSTTTTTLTDPTILNSNCASAVQENNVSKCRENGALMLNTLNFMNIPSMSNSEDGKKLALPQSSASSSSAFTAEFMEKLTAMINASASNVLASKSTQTVDDAKLTSPHYNFELPITQILNGISSSTTSSNLSAPMKETLNTPFANLFLHYSTALQSGGQRDALLLLK